MILQALTRYYEHLLEQGADSIASPGYSQERIGYEIVLSCDGRIVGCTPFSSASVKKGKNVPWRMLSVPASFKRSGTGSKAFFLWDKTSYALGVGKNKTRAQQNHEAFKILHREALMGSDDPGLNALLIFLETWKPEQLDQNEHLLRQGEKMLDANVVFRLDGEQRYLHERSAARELWAEMKSDDNGAGGFCLITGARSQIARIHPAIKGIGGTDKAVTSIVSFNKDSFKSYGKDQGANAPVSQEAAFAYTAALNYLLRAGTDNFQKLQIGDTTVVFWAEADDAEQAEEAELTFGALLNGVTADDDSEAQKIRDVLENVGKGRPLASVDPKLQDGTRMFVLGLAPNASRLSIRFWEVGTLGIFARRFAEHARDFRIEPLPWRTAPSAWRVVLATIPTRILDKSKRDISDLHINDRDANTSDAIKNLVGEFMRSVLSGRPYPRSLLSAALLRIRSDKRIAKERNDRYVFGLRAAICKAIPSREHRLGLRQQEEECPVSLNPDSESTSYQLGRLFAVMEGAQRAALGKQINATIRDKYYASASATPAAVFSTLLRGAQNHISKLRKDRKSAGLGYYFDQQMGEIIKKLPDHFPANLSIDDQGRFAIGYYHQAWTRREEKERTADPENNVNGELE